MACKREQFNVVKVVVTNQFKALSINLNAQQWIDSVRICKINIGRTIISYSM